MVYLGYHRGEITQNAVEAKANQIRLGKAKIGHA